MSFEEALEATRVNNVFTTHTPVPAGIDLFDPGLVYHYFNHYCREANIDFDRFMALGRRNPQRRRRAALDGDSGAERFRLSQRGQPACIATFRRRCGIRCGRRCPFGKTPITSVTNGVHLPSWLNGDLADLYDQYLEPDWRDRWNEHAVWEQINDIPDEELLEMHRRRKRRLIAFIRDRQTASATAGKPRLPNFAMRRKFSTHTR